MDDREHEPRTSSAPERTAEPQAEEADLDEAEKEEMEKAAKKRRERAAIERAEDEGMVTERAKISRVDVPS